MSATKWCYMALLVVLSPVRGGPAEVPEPSHRSVRVTAVMYKYAAPHGLGSIREVDFKTLQVVIFDLNGHPWQQFRLRKGGCERQAAHEMDEVSLGEVYYFKGPHDTAERALLELEWLSEAGSSSNWEYVLVFEVRGGDLFATQQISYNLQAPGTLDRFYPDGLALIVLGRTADYSAHGSPRSLTEVTFEWNGKEFQVRSAQKLLLEKETSNPSQP